MKNRIKCVMRGGIFIPDTHEMCDMPMPDWVMNNSALKKSAKGLEYNLLLEGRGWDFNLDKMFEVNSVNDMERDLVRIPSIRGIFVEEQLPWYLTSIMRRLINWTRKSDLVWNKLKNIFTGRGSCGKNGLWAYVSYRCYY